MEIANFLGEALTEDAVYQALLPAFRETLAANGLDDRFLTLRRAVDKTGYSSVFIATIPIDQIHNAYPQRVDSYVAMRISTRKKQPYFSIRAQDSHLMPETIQVKLLEKYHSDGFVNFYFSPDGSDIPEYAPFLAKALDAAIDDVAKEFDCCSRFWECSDCGKCIHPNPDFSIYCGYRKALKQGKVFYGKNRNID